MSLTDRLAAARQRVDSTDVSIEVGTTVSQWTAPSVPAPRSSGTVRPQHRRTDPFAEVKRTINRNLLEAIGPRLYDASMTEAELEQRVRLALNEVMAAEQTPLTSIDRTRITQEVADDILGYGPLEPYLRDTDVTEIMVNGPDRVYVERSGKIYEVDARFLDESHLRRTIDKIVSRIGRRIDESSPMVDARLADGSRVNAIIPPLAVDYPILTIRKFSADPFQVDDLISFGTLTSKASEFLNACVRGKLNVLVSGGTGAGKAQPLDANIATPHGWASMGSLKVGDSVIGVDGTACAVTGVFPQGEENVYRITFKDRSSVECSDGHLWSVRTRKDKYRDRPWRVMTTMDIVKWQQDHPQETLYIPMVEPVEYAFTGTELPCDPYLLGVLLGDGYFYDGSPMLYNPEKDITDRVSTLLPEGVSLVPALLHGQTDQMSYRISAGKAGLGRTNQVTELLRDLGLWGSHSTDKFIPEVFKFATPAERLSLLQGLCDTDGYVRPGSNFIEFATSSTRLAVDVRELVESLGGTAKTTTRIPGFTYRGEHRKGQVSHRITVKLPSSMNPFWVPRKAESYVPATKYQVTRAITNVEFVGRKQTQCISVDALDHLYVTEHFIVTHNTTTLNVLSSFIPADERIVTIEDAAELQLHQPHVLRLESRPSNIEGRGEVAIRDLVKNSLRMRPDRIIVGEIRDAAALDMLQAMNTGHDGSICTVHANSPRDALARVETMVLMAGVDLPIRAIREQAASALDIIVQQARFKDGSRRITHISEVVGMEGDVITMQDLFTFDYGMGFDAEGRNLGVLRSSGLRPKVLDKLSHNGVTVDPSLFAFERFGGKK